MYLDPNFPIGGASHFRRVLDIAGAMGRIRFRPRSGPKELDCWIYQPMHRDVSAAPLIAVHGLRRRSREQVEMLSERARMQGRVVIAPIFDEERWPRYQQVVIRGRADKALLRLIDELGEELVVAPKKFIFSGFSGGAQFVHRFAMLYPHLVERLIVSSPGWYTFPDNAVYPFGLSRPSNRRALDNLESNLGAFLKLPITVTIGELDNRQDANTYSCEQIDARQGATRLERAGNWVSAIRQCAAWRGIESSVQLVTLKRCRHNFKRCVLRGGLDAIILPSLQTDRMSAARQNWTESEAA